jgi:uncharacterized membrane protein
MLTENKELMQQAREDLKGKWGVAIGTSLLYIIMVGVFQAIPRIGPIITLFISGPLAYGLAQFSLHIARNEEARIEQLLEGFQNYTRNFITYLLVIVFTLLWFLCLIIPGIIASISYSMTFYILTDDESLTPMKAIDKSKTMMNGHKLKFFYLILWFLLLSLLCILTLGIGFLFLIPFMSVTIAKFYENIKDIAVIYEV